MRKQLISVAHIRDKLWTTKWRIQFDPSATEEVWFLRRRYSCRTLAIGSGPVLKADNDITVSHDGNTRAYYCSIHSWRIVYLSLHAQTTETVRPVAHSAKSSIAQ